LSLVVSLPHLEVNSVPYLILSLRRHQSWIMPNFCRLATNFDHEYECYGCQVIGTMFRKRHHLDSNTTSTQCTVICTFHNSFFELENCAKRGCATCRVFQRALWLRQVTKQEADWLGRPHLQDRVWARLGPTQPRGSNPHPDQTLLEIGIGDPPQDRKTAMVLCTSEQGKRPVNLDGRFEEIAIIEAKRWLQHCYDPKGSHTECKNLSWSRCNPSNLIEIVSRAGDLRLVETSNVALVPYAALSYSWGDHLANSKSGKAKVESHRTTRDLKDDNGNIIEKGGGNLEQRRKLFSTSQLPHTIRDVIKLTWDLGIRYIWIDAMCILPGADWNDEASKMHEVYDNAYVTLAICSSEMTTDGLLATR